MSSFFRLTLSAHQVEAMVRHAQSEMPNECCGVLAGTVQDQVGFVTEHYSLVNDLASPTAFRTEPRSLLHAEKEVRRLGIEVLGFYHSHPTSAPIPSRTDLTSELTYGPDVMYFIISLQGEVPELRAWWMREGVAEEADWQMA